MGAILVLTPLVISAWPAVAAAIMGAAASMGFAVSAPTVEQEEEATRTNKIETEIENSEVVAEQMNRGEKVVITKDDITVEFGRDNRGACTVCVSGKGHSEKELHKIGEEIAGRVVQQYAYHKLMTELKKRNYSVVDEKVMQDQSIQVRIRL
ncbi:MAG TPA: DUF1257 domain-containing protein [Phycisphaerae bacterium]|nr:DUF1257 domain-containing protein [Phycisphaerae bacterium]